MKQLLILLGIRTKAKINRFDDNYFDNLTKRMQILKNKMDNYKQTNNK